jgi:hypothetical protein
MHARADAFSNEMTSFEIEFQLFETVMRGGTRRVTWHISEQDAWLSVADYPGARVEQQERAPGTVWRRHVRVSLPLGAQLMRVDSEPAADAPRDPLAYLWGAPRAAGRRVRRSYFSVVEHGKLERLPQRPE